MVYEAGREGNCEQLEAIRPAEERIGASGTKL